MNEDKSESKNTEELRTHTVSSRLNAEELARLDKRRAKLKMRRGEYLRVAALSRLPKTIPAINQEAWVALARVSANLNQIAKRLNSGDSLPIDAVKKSVDDLRLVLIGVSFDKGCDDEGEA